MPYKESQKQNWKKWKGFAQRDRALLNTKHPTEGWFSSEQIWYEDSTNEQGSPQKAATQLLGLPSLFFF